AAGCPAARRRGQRGRALPGGGSHRRGINGGPSGAVLRAHHRRNLDPTQRNLYSRAPFRALLEETIQQPRRGRSARKRGPSETFVRGLDILYYQVGTVGGLADQELLSHFTNRNSVAAEQAPSFNSKGRYKLTSFQSLFQKWPVRASGGRQPPVR